MFRFSFSKNIPVSLSLSFPATSRVTVTFRENLDMDFVMMIAPDRNVVSYRSVKDGVNVRQVAEAFGGKGHDKAATNPISIEVQNELVKV